MSVLLFDFKTARQDCVVFVLSYECIVLSSDYDTFRSLLMQLYWPVVNKVSKALYGTFHVHHLLERSLISLISKSTKIIH